MFLDHELQWEALICRNVHSNELNATIIILMLYLVFWNDMIPAISKISIPKYPLG